MNILSNLNWRYATKKMTGEKVPSEIIDNILEAIRLSPSSYGLQPFHIFVIENQELKNKISPIAHNQAQICNCSHLLVFAAYSNLSKDIVSDYIKLIALERNQNENDLIDFKNIIISMIESRKGDENFNWAAKQAYIALGIAIAAAAEYKVDATPMEGYNYAALDQLLGLGKMNLRSTNMLAIGYRDEQTDHLSLAKKVRKSKEVLFSYFK